ncbi:MAG: alpha-amylase family glycosyl hydrolase, partial [Chloroflexota bacterium]
MRPSAQFGSELWDLPANECELDDGQVYHYWFKVRDTNPYDGATRVLYCTDPAAWTVDRRVLAPAPQAPEGVASGRPAAVVLYRDGRLLPCDPGGETVAWDGDTPLESLPPNNRLVVYELPTRWARSGEHGTLVVGTGTFQDVLAQIEPEASPPGFRAMAALRPGRAHIVELGANALELLPPADSDHDLEWGYGTAHFFAADDHLGRPFPEAPPTASRDLAHLVKACHRQGVRFFYDAVMAFSRNDPYRHANFLDFHVQWNSGDPEQRSRDGFGGDLLKYNFRVDGYDPLSGERGPLFPARALMKAHIAHWMDHYRIDGLRLDSVNSIDNYDFVGEVRQFARARWRQRGGADDRFLVVGEELSVPSALLAQGRLDGLWNERFKQLARQVLLGRNADDEPSFEWSVRRLIDCRLLRDHEGRPIFTDGAQAVNYLTSHDVGGYENERLYTFLVSNGLPAEPAHDQEVFATEKRVKLAFVCLLTAVGIPMILAGDEFA